MAIGYIQGGNDDLGPLSSVGIDDDSGTGWWGGAQRCFAAISIAAVLATAVLSTEVAAQISQDREEIPAGSLFISAGSNTYQDFRQFSLAPGKLSVRPAWDSADDYPLAVANQVDEDFWQNPVAPVAAPNRLVQQWPFDEQEPAGSLFGQADEDFWINEVNPVAVTLFQRLPLGDADEVLPTTTVQNQFDEDFWINAVAPTSLNFARAVFTDPDEIPAGSLFGQYDEDFWQNPVAAIAARLYQQLPLGDPEEIPAGRLFGQADEDFWSNPVAPVAASNRSVQQWSFDEQEPAGSLFGQAEEDLWQNPVAPVAASYRALQPWVLDEQEPPLFEAEEFFGEKDAWQNWLQPTPAALYQRLPLGDPEEIPAGTLFGQDDEDFWQNPVAPVLATNRLVQQWPFDEQEPAGSLYGQAEEEFWQNPVAPIAAANRLVQQWPFDEQEPPLFEAEEFFGEKDFWQNWIQPAPATLYRSPLFADLDELPAGSLLVGQPDEDFWLNPTRPLAATLYQSLPYLFESADLVPAVQPIPDEDFWANPTAPIVASLYQRLPLGDPEEIPAGRLFGQAEEDFWQNPVAPVVASYRLLQPWLLDEQEPPLFEAEEFFGEKDAWQTWLQPTPATLYQRLPFCDPDEIPAGSLFGQFDEDFWNNPVAPLAAAVYRSPLFTDPEEVPGTLLKSQAVDEYYWQNPVAPVAASSYQRLPYLFESAEVIGPVTGFVCNGSGTQSPQSGRGAVLWFVPAQHRVTSAGHTPRRVWGGGEGEQAPQEGRGEALLGFCGSGLSLQSAGQDGYGECLQLLAISGDGVAGQARTHAAGKAQVIDVELEMIAALLALS